MTFNHHGWDGTMPLRAGKRNNPSLKENKMLRLMKLTLLLIVCCIQVSAFTGTQVTYSAKEVSLEKVFEAIKKQTSYSVFYSLEDYRHTKKVTVGFTNASVEEVMKKCLKGQPLYFIVEGKTIFIVKKKKPGPRLGKVHVNFERGKTGIKEYNGDMGFLISADNFPYEGNIISINQNDVESIRVLKDADATHIWGAMAGNGVILIATKKGKSGTAQIDFNFNITIHKKPDLCSRPLSVESDYIGLEKFLFKKRYYKRRINSTSHFSIIPLFKQRNC